MSTDCNWLVVYDNVESADILRPYWPSLTRGRVIITTRYDSLASDPASVGLEIPSWDSVTGSQFLLWLLQNHPDRELPSESGAAMALSERLGGHALAISHIAGLIQSSQLSIRDFMGKYLEDPRTAHEREEFTAIWELSFKSLNDDSRWLLGVMAFLMPDAVPHEVFASLPDSKRQYPAGLAFCSDDFRLSKVIASLASLGLIKRYINKGTLSIHRMVQTQFKCFMTLEQRLECFNCAVSLIWGLFPTENSKAGQMYGMWEACNQYAQQVVTLRDCFQEEQKLSKDFKPSWQFCDLLCRSQRYFYDTNAMDECERTRLHPFNGGCMYNIGVTCLLQGKVEAAIQHLRDSLEVTKFHKNNRPAEHARSLFKLSEALLQDPHPGSAEEAAALWDEAQRYLKMRKPDVVEGSTDSVYDSLVSIIYR